MKKPFIFLTFLFLFYSINALFSQASAWKAYISDFSSGTNVTLPDAPICSYIGNGALHLPHNSNNYFTNFEFNSNICVTNNFTFEYRLRNAPQYGGLSAYDVGFDIIMPQGDIGASLMSNDMAGLPWTFYNVLRQRRSVLPNFVRNLDEYSIVKVTCTNNVATIFHNDTLLLSLPYNGSICTINQLKFWFKGSGYIDWVKITNLDDNKIVYLEDFTSCNNIKSPDATICQTPTVSITTNTPCEGDTLRITTTTNRAASFEWAGPNGFSSTNSQVVIPKTDLSAGGTYFLQTRFNVCQSLNQNINVRIRPTPKVNLGKDTIYCEPKLLTLNGGTPDNIYIWNDGSSDFDLTVKESGVYAVKVTTPEGCFAMDTIKIDMPQTVLNTQLTAVDPTCFAICDGSIDAITEGGFGAPYTYTWTSNATQNLCAGNYKLTVTDAKGCKITSDTTLIEPTKMQITALATTDYNGFNVSCFDSNNGAISATTIGGNGGFIYKWQGIPNLGSSSITDLAAGVYHVTSTDAKGCQDSAQVTITAPTALKMAYQVKNIRCFGEKNGMVTLSGIIGGVKPFVVKFDQKAVSDSFALFQNLAAGVYPLQVTDANQCLLADSINLTEPPKMIPIATSDTLIHFGDDVPLFAGLQYPSVLSSVKWSANRDSVALACDNCAQTIASPRKTTIFHAFMTDTFGCNLNKDILVHVDKNRKIFAPTAFSPNEDGQNDKFCVFGGSGTRRILYVKMFNRWGSLIFVHQNPTMHDDSDGWDGKYNGQDLPSDVYIWIAEIEFEDGEHEVFKGDVVLMR